MDMRLLAGVVLVFALGCENGQSPVQPTPSASAAPQVATPLVFSLSGSVQDSASRPIAGSRVEIIAGDRSGIFETTDANGRFRMPGTFTGTVTVRASKDGYKAESSTLPPTVPFPRVLVAPPPPNNLNFSMSLSLEPESPPVNIAGEYTLTITADRSCSALPDEARTRTYRAEILPGRRATAFQGRIRDARFISTSPCPGPPDSCIHNYFDIGMAGDFASLWTRILEQVSETLYVVVDGGLSAPFGPSGMSGPLNAQIMSCPVLPVWNYDFWTCPAETGARGVDCSSIHHQLTMVPR
jgi:hypothetical protein